MIHTLLVVLVVTLLVVFICVSYFVIVKLGEFKSILTKSNDFLSNFCEYEKDRIKLMQLNIDANTKIHKIADRIFKMRKEEKGVETGRLIAKVDSIYDSYMEKSKESVTKLIMKRDRIKGNSNKVEKNLNINLG